MDNQNSEAAGGTSHSNGNGNRSRDHMDRNRCNVGVDEPVPEKGEVRALITMEKPVEPDEEHEEEYIELEVLARSSAKTYMCVYAITDRSSKQYRFIHESGEITIDEEGYLRDSEGFYGVALGSYFGAIGSRYIFTLDTGITIPVVKVEEKADKDTIDGFHHALDGSVIEFVVDTGRMKDNVWANGLIYSGNFNNCPDFAGTIVKIEKVE